MSGITLSHKHGVAPALMFCRICGKDTNGLALLGASCDKTMRELHEATGGQYGSREGYQEYGYNKIPDSEPCDECKAYLQGGCIIIAEDTREYLRLTKDMTDSLVGRVGAEGRCIDFDAMRGKIVTMKKAFWVADGLNIRLRDPKIWMEKTI
jgi:hypothetical protein